jgi:hypothetical protein
MHSLADFIGLNHRVIPLVNDKSAEYGGWTKGFVYSLCAVSRVYAYQEMGHSDFLARSVWENRAVFRSRKARPDREPVSYRPTTLAELRHLTVSLQPIPVQ